MNKPLTTTELASLNPVAIIERTALNSAVALAAMCVEKRNTMPVLSNLRLTGDGGTLTVTGTDLDTEIKVRVAGPADARFDTTIPAHMLKTILAKAKASSMVTLEAHKKDSGDDGKCDVSLGGTRYDLNSIPSGDFPSLELGKRVASFTLPAAEFSTLISKTQYAISTEEMRYYLNGVYLHYHKADNALKAVATDGHRLSLTAMPAPEGSEGMPGVIFPRQAVKYVLDILKALGKQYKGYDVPDIGVEIWAEYPDNSGIKLRFNIGDNITIATKTIDGTFPNYEQVIPSDPTPRGTMSVKRMHEAIEQVTLVSMEKSRACKFTMSRGKCKLTVNDPDAGSAHTQVESSYDGEEMAIGFNARHVLDTLAEISGDEFTVEFEDYGSPAVFRDPNNANWFGVLMPLRV